MKYRWKKIIVNQQKGKYVIVKLFNVKEDMQDYYASAAPQDKGHYRIAGCHIGFARQKYSNGHWRTQSKHTGTVLLHANGCGTGIVSHELMHAVFWAKNHPKVTKQHPIVLKSMKDEEIVLHNLTDAVIQFYDWFYTVTTTKNGTYKL